MSLLPARPPPAPAPTLPSAPSPPPAPLPTPPPTPNLLKWFAFATASPYTASGLDARSIACLAFSRAWTPATWSSPCAVCFSVSAAAVADARWPNSRTSQAATALSDSAKARFEKSGMFLLMCGNGCCCFRAIIFRWRAGDNEIIFVEAHVCRVVKPAFNFFYG